LDGPLYSRDGFLTQEVMAICILNKSLYPNDGFDITKANVNLDLGNKVVWPSLLEIPKKPRKGLKGSKYDRVYI
jgi:hypothetical protein